jgi:hypothetical protein
MYKTHESAAAAHTETSVVVVISAWAPHRTHSKRHFPPSTPSLGDGGKDLGQPYNCFRWLRLQLDAMSNNAAIVEVETL